VFSQHFSCLQGPGICARLQENYNLALSSLAKCVAFAPQDPECFRELALLSIIAGKYDDASTYASEALLYDPSTQNRISRLHYPNR